MNKLTDFMIKRKKENRNSLIIDNFNYDDENKEVITRRSSISLNHEQDRYRLFSEDVKETKGDDKSKTEKNLRETNSTVSKNIQKFNQSKPTFKSINYECFKCKNNSTRNESFMILNCSHIFHIECLVEIHFEEFTNCRGIIDEVFIDNCKCMVCDQKMDIEDILHIHNKFTKCTKKQVTFQTDQINLLDKQMSKLKEEMRIQLEYKQRLEDKRNKSKQITITLNNLL